MNINRCKQCGNKFPDIKSDTVPIAEMKELSNTVTYKRVFRIECPCGMKTVDTSSERQAIEIWNRDYQMNKKPVSSDSKDVTYRNIEKFINMLMDNSYITISKMIDNNTSIEDTYIHIKEVNELSNLTCTDRDDINRQSYIMFNEYGINEYPHGWAVDVSMLTYRRSSDSVNKKSVDEAIDEVIFIPAISDDMFIYDTTTNTLDIGDDTYYISKLAEKKFNLRWASSDSVYRMLGRELSYNNEKLKIEGVITFRYMKRDKRYYNYKPNYTSDNIIKVSRAGGGYTHYYKYSLYNFKEKEES